MLLFVVDYLRSMQNGRKVESHWISRFEPVSKVANKVAVTCWRKVLQADKDRAEPWPNDS